MRPTVLLFDIDGTLLDTGGAGRRAINRAFAEVHGRPDACDAIAFDGMTDQAILRLGLEAIGVPPARARLDEVLARYLACLEEEVQRVPAAAYVVHPGAREAVQAGLDAGCAVGLGTGNVREGARRKLERVDLYRHFAFGGFGDVSESRPELLLDGARQGAAHLGRPLTECRVVVVGDTPKDVAAALAIGAECLAVATGRSSVETLLAAGATCAFETMASAGALDALLSD